MTNRHVLVVDDEPSIVDAVATALRYEGFCVDECGDGAEALRALQSTPYDLAVLDVMLPHLSGFDVCAQLRAEGSRVPVLFLTARGDPDDRVAGLRGGGDDYVVKPFVLAEVVARVQAILRRTEGEPETNVLRFADIVLDEQTHEVWRGGVALRMTATEFRLLRFFMRNPRHVLSKAQILDNVWHYDFDGDANVVETYVRYLRRKLDAHGPPVIHTTRLVGYSLREPALREPAS